MLVIGRICVICAMCRPDPLYGLEKITTAYTDLELGAGNSVTIRHLVEQIAELTQTRTQLRFGALPYRENEIMESKADIRKLLNLRWRPKYDLITGLKTTIESVGF